MARMVWVTVYEIGRAYGGPEEGGWWYEYGQPHTEWVNVVFREGRYGREVVSNDEQVVSFKVPHRIRHKIQNKLQQRFPRTGRSNSVLGGEDFAVHIEDRPPAAYPDRRPYYC